MRFLSKVYSHKNKRLNEKDETVLTSDEPDALGKRHGEVVVIDIVVPAT